MNQWKDIESALIRVSKDYKGVRPSPQGNILLSLADIWCGYEVIAHFLDQARGGV